MTTLSCWRSVAGALALTLAVGLALAVSATGAEDDTAAIKARTAEFVAAWNKHDPKAMASLWADDGDLINPWGRVATGRAAVEALFVDEQTGKGALRATTFRLNSENVRTPMPGIAVVDIDLTISGAYGPDGEVQAKPLEMHATWIWKRSGDAWLVFACRPYTKAPTAPAPAVR